MHRLAFFPGLLLFTLLFNAGFSQSLKPKLIDNKLFYIDTIIKQNKCIFKFWRHHLDTVAENSDEGDTLKYRLVIERITKIKDTIIFNDDVKDGDYGIWDVNGDGYVDLVTFYHENEEVHFFEPSANIFRLQSLTMLPAETLDNTRHIYSGFQAEAIYGSKYAYSVLYRYKGFKAWCYYLLAFITTEDNEGKEAAKHINLYQCRNGQLNDTVFIKEIKTSKPAEFDDKKYWEDHYKELLGLPANKTH